MAKTKKIKFELLVVTDGEEKRKSWKPQDFLKHLLFNEVHGLVTIVVIIIIYFSIIYSGNLIKRILEWLLKIVMS